MSSGASPGKAKVIFHLLVMDQFTISGFLLIARRVIGFWYPNHHARYIFNIILAWEKVFILLGGGFRFFLLSRLKDSGLRYC